MTFFPQFACFLREKSRAWKTSENCYDDFGKYLGLDPITVPLRIGYEFRENDGKSWAMLAKSLGIFFFYFLKIPGVF